MRDNSDGGHRQDEDCAEIDEHRGTQATAPATDPLQNLGAALPSGDPQEQIMSEWQPIATAPKDGRPVLVYIPEGHPRKASQGLRVAHWEQPWKCWQLLPGQLIVIPTHWMPLPDPPVARPPQEPT